MQIHRLSATFGRLENETLELSSGLNVIEAPNEGGKSTWTAFLRVMFYGLNTRDRSETADKRRHSPWSGSPMQGALEVSTDAGDLTLTRRTLRAGSPMGAFSAVYTGTAAPVEGLTAVNCGETLLGVPQEVFTRSAFIRQSGVAVDQDAALERRVSALISTGEEDVSFTDVSARLRKQLNARRHNQTGRLPQLEREQRELQETLASLDALSGSLDHLNKRRAALQAQIAALQAQLSQHDAADLYQAAQAAAAARRELQSAQAAVSHLPPQDELAALRASIPILQSQTKAVSAAQARADATAQALRKAEAAAPPPVETPAPPRLPLLPVLLGLLLGILAGVLLFLWRHSLPAALLAAGAMAAAGLLVAFLSRRRRWSKERARLADAQRAADTLYNSTLTKAQNAHRDAQADLRAARQTSAESLIRLLTQVRTFQPLVGDLPGAELAIGRALAARDRADRAQRAWELLPKPAAPVDLTAPPPPVPALDRGTLRLRLSQAEAELRILDRDLHTAQGRRETIGNSADLRAQLAEKETQHAALQDEYDAIALALETLTAANTQLQTRFSPALGKRAAEIFSQLTGGKYNKVLLDRDMTPSAQESGQPLPHQAVFLSQGTADQLYLAVRLAICDLVLPPEKAVPIILDDALVTFDDRRLAAALDYLADLSQTRQILLFTCQHRETAYLRQAHSGRFHLVTL